MPVPERRKTSQTSVPGWVDPLRYSGPLRNFCSSPKAMGLAIWPFLQKGKRRGKEKRGSSSLFIHWSTHCESPSCTSSRTWQKLCIYLLVPSPPPSVPRPSIAQCLPQPHLAWPMRPKEYQQRGRHGAGADDVGIFGNGRVAMGSSCSKILGMP